MSVPAAFNAEVQTESAAFLTYFDTETQPVTAKEEEDDLMIEVKLKLTPEVVDAFKATGRGWKEKINEVPVMLVGKEKTPA